MDIETIEVRDLVAKIRYCVSPASGDDCEGCQWQTDCIHTGTREFWYYVADVLEEMAEKIDRYEVIIEALPIKC